MTTFILGAGASFHAGYPLASGLWPGLVGWMLGSNSVRQELRDAVHKIASLHGAVTDAEAMLTDLDLGKGAFLGLDKDQRKTTTGAIRRGIGKYFTHLANNNTNAVDYARLVQRIKSDDVVVTFNYDVALERELIRAGKFMPRDGYGFHSGWIEPASSVKVLKLHGSINWFARLANAQKGYRPGPITLGKGPLVDDCDRLFSEYPIQMLDADYKREPGVEFTTLVLPTREKRFSVGEEWTQFYDELWSAAVDALSRSNHVAIIGYSMPAADRRARSVILWRTNKDAEVTVCCGPSNASLAAEFERHGFWRVSECGTFQDYLATQPSGQ